MTSERYLSYRHFLSNELKTRQEKDRNYSLRAFARELNIRSSRLGEILNGKVGLSEERALQIAERLKISHDETNIFVDLVQSRHGRGSMTKKLAQERLRTRFPEARQIQLDEFEIIADWYHLALVELIGAGTDQSPAVLAKRLGLPTGEVEAALERLQRTGLIERHENLLRPADKNRVTQMNEIPSLAKRSFNQQVLGKAEKAMERQSIQERDFSSMFFSVNKEHLPRFKEMLEGVYREFQIELDSQANTPSNDVYCLSTQLFALTENV